MPRFEEVGPREVLGCRVVLPETLLVLGAFRAALVADPRSRRAQRTRLHVASVTLQSTDRVPTAVASTVSPTEMVHRIGWLPR
jgi:hypothetical protein